MGIDRIGKGGAAPPPIDTTQKSSAPFAVRPASTNEPQAVSGAAAAQGNGPLERLRAGEIDTHTYVELKVDEATRHLSGLRADELEAIKAELRHRVAADPALADLVQQATGTRFTPPEE